MDLRALTHDLLAQATGRAHRPDAALAGGGGPAGNARLTAWTGLVLLVLFAAELVTLLDVRGLISWHFAIGVLLIPPALVKTGSTGWRIVRYYTGHRAYRAAGPPPLVLRLLGPVVVASTLAVLGTGLALVFVGPDASRRPLFAGLDPVMLHKATFVVWAVATGAHTLARAVPALQLTVLRRPVPPAVPGRLRRGAVLLATMVVAVVAAAVVLAGSGAWRSQPREFHPPGRYGYRGDR